MLPGCVSRATSSRTSSTTATAATRGVHISTAGREMQRHPERVLREAVAGMLPKNRLGRRLATKLKIYAGAEHPHSAQQPEQVSN